MPRISWQQIVGSLWFIVLLLIIVPFASAEGCCCNTQTGLAEPDSAQPDANACAQELTFLEITSEERFAKVTCSEKCIEEFGERAYVCGDGYCNEPEETPDSCPVDCKRVIALCGDPLYNPPPRLFRVLPVKSQPILELFFTLECPQSIQFLDIYRCTGKDCTDFKKIDTIAPTTSYKDFSELSFNQDYSYKIEAQYSSGKSSAVKATGNLGNIECLSQNSPVFCISDGYYNKYKNLLQKQGHGILSAQSFQNEFINSVSAEFNTRFNQAWKCNDLNKLYQDLPKVQCDASKNEVCVIRGSSAQCITPSVCENNRPFGLFNAVESCEGLEQNPNYCYFDRKTGIINTCNNCPTDYSLQCYDYKTKGACENDNCNVGNCAWRNIFPSLGIGVCIDTAQNNCHLCTEKNSLFDSCYAEKAKALSTNTASCYYSPTFKQALDCSRITCQDYELEQDCGTPLGGVKLNQDNSIQQKSIDPCGIGACQFQPQGCMKNADGNTGPGSEDCSKGDRNCELDYFPPETQISLTGNKNEFLHIRIKDKKTKEDPLRDLSEKPGYFTYLCLVTATKQCNDASSFDIKINASRLVLNNLVLFEKKQRLATLQEGKNILKFFSKDNSSNLEQIKSIEISACDNCQGPVVDFIKVEGAKRFDDFFYTNNIQPAISVEFITPTQITTAELIREGKTVQLKQTNSGFNIGFTFIPTSPLTEGAYTFRLSALNQKNIELTQQAAIGLVIDTTPPTVEVTPDDGTAFETQQVSVKLLFSEPIITDNLILEEDTFVNKFASVPEESKVIDILQTKDNKVFEGKLTHKQDGVMTFVIDVTDFAGNILQTTSSYSVNTGIGKIRLKQPSWGITSQTQFDIIIQTTTKSECSYAYDLPTIPPANEQNFLASKRFDKTSGNFHVVQGFNRLQDRQEHHIDIFCKDKNGIMYERFTLSIDTTPLFIIEAFASPEKISETSDQIQDLYETTLNIVLNEEGFCRYADESTSFDKMKNFQNYDRVPKIVLQTPIKVMQQKDYEYFVQCKDKAELLSNTKIVSFSVDLSQNFSIESKTKKGFNSPDIELRIFTNKKSVCFYGEDERSITNPLGESEISFFHKQLVSASGNASGILNYYVRCTSTQGEIAEAKVEIFVDLTPPTLNIDVSTDYYLDRKISWDLDMFKIRLEGQDEETGIAGFYYLIENIDGQVVADWAFTDRTDGKSFYVKQKSDNTPIMLIDKTSYRVRARAVNKAGLHSEEIVSDFVLIDSSVEPEHCINERHDPDQGEIGADCGGTCSGACKSGDFCQTNENCESNICKEGICQAPSCNDKIKTFDFETDIDCGGQCPTKCSISSSCKINSDCELDFCQNFVCEQPGPCEDKHLSSETGETDIDCGGLCGSCSAGKNCNSNKDCSSGLSCNENVCTILAEADSDADSIKDDQDICLETPSGEQVERIGPYAGCSEEQRYTKWIINNFGSAEAEGAGKYDDPDNDGLNNWEEFILYKNYKQSTDPLNADTDGDGWNDNEEVKKGYNPLNEKEHPPSLIWTLFKWMIILAILGIIGYGGHYSYKRWVKDWLEEKGWLKKKEMPFPILPKPLIRPPISIKPPVKVPPISFKKPPEKILKELKKLAKPKKEEYLTLKELAGKIKKKDVSKEVFEKLKKFREKRR